MEKLLKVSLSLSLLGIFLLVFLANFLSPPNVNLGDVDNSMMNKKVRVQGSVFKVVDKQGFVIVSMADDTGKIDVLCNSNLTGLKDIIVEGRVSEYNGYLQIQADKIIKK